MYFDTFSKRAKRAVFFAHHYAKKSCSRAIEPEHLLHGLLDEDPELFQLLKPDDNAFIEDLKKQLAVDSQGKRAEPLEGHLPLSKASQQVVRTSNEARQRFNQSLTGTAHLLLAILTERDPRRTWFGLRPSAPLLHDALQSYGVTADALLPLVQNGHPTPQTPVIDDLILLVNAKLSALGEALIQRGVFSREEYVSLLDKHEDPLTAQAYMVPLLDALLDKGTLDAKDRSEILENGETPKVSPPENV
jgi:hypothetical protein